MPRQRDAPGPVAHVAARGRLGPPAALPAPRGGARHAAAPPAPLPLPAPTPSGPDATVLAAGDITGCNDEAEATARLLDARPAATVLALGDNAYPQGTAQQYADCYDPTWGRAKARTLPTPGNHEYDTPGATGYFGYFGAAAGPGYYSADRGTWHLVSLNDARSTASATSAQYRWLEADLAAHPAACTLAFWHRPRFSGGSHGDFAGVAPLLALLHARGADVVLAGHDHTYQRWAPMGPSGASTRPAACASSSSGPAGGATTRTSPPARARGRRRQDLRRPRAHPPRGAL